MYYPSFNCPFISQGVDTVYMPKAQQPMPPFQPMLPVNAPESPYTPLYQAPGIHMPGGFGGVQGMDYMDTMMEDTDLEAMAPLVASPGDPPPVLSNNPAVTSLVLFKELTGYPNYGNPSGNADILYTGNRGTWTFDFPAFLFVPGNLTAQLVIRAVLDDHSAVPVNRYSARIMFNGVQIHTGPVPLQHGVPAGQRFNNWRSLTFNVTNIRRTNRVVIVNTSQTGADDWIGLDWMELRLAPR